MAKDKKEMSVISRSKRIAKRILRPHADDLRYNLAAFVRRLTPVNNCGWSSDFKDRVEILVPCYNHAQHLPAAIKSIVQQTWAGSLTVTFINDNSTDNTRQVIHELVDKYSSNKIRMHTIENTKNLRQDGSLNKAIDSSPNELFIVLNDDDALCPDAVSVIIETFSNHKELAMVGGSSIWFEDTVPTWKQPAQSKHLTKYNPPQAKQFRDLNDINMTHSSCAFSKYAWAAVGGYRRKGDRLTTEINEDRDFQMRVAACFPVGVYKDYPLAFWRTDSSHGKDF